MTSDGSIKKLVESIAVQTQQLAGIDATMARAAETAAEHLKVSMKSAVLLRGMSKTMSAPRLVEKTLAPVPDSSPDILENISKNSAGIVSELRSVLDSSLEIEKYADETSRKMSSLIRGQTRMTDRISDVMHHGFSAIRRVIRGDQNVTPPIPSSGQDPIHSLAELRNPGTTDGTIPSNELSANSQVIPVLQKIEESTAGILSKFLPILTEIKLSSDVTSSILSKFVGSINADDMARAEEKKDTMSFFERLFKDKDAKEKKESSSSNDKGRGLFGGKLMDLLKGGILGLIPGLPALARLIPKFKFIGKLFRRLVLPITAAISVITSAFEEWEKISDGSYFEQFGAILVGAGKGALKFLLGVPAFLGDMIKDYIMAPLLSAFGKDEWAEKLKGISFMEMSKKLVDTIFGFADHIGGWIGDLINDVMAAWDYARHGIFRSSEEKLRELYKENLDAVGGDHEKAAVKTREDTQGWRGKQKFTDEEYGKAESFWKSSEKSRELVETAEQKRRDDLRKKVDDAAARMSDRFTFGLTGKLRNLISAREEKEEIEENAKKSQGAGNTIVAPSTTNTSTTSNRISNMNIVPSNAIDRTTGALIMNRFGAVY